MSQHGPSLIADLRDSAPLAGPSLQDVLDALPAATGPSQQAKRNMASSARKLAQILERQPELIVVSAPVLRRHFAQASPGAFGVSASRWANIKSDVRRAVRLTGLGGDRRPERFPLSEAWEQLVAIVDERNARNLVRRFGRFCSGAQIAPLEVDDGVVDRFHAHLDQNQLSKIPKRIAKDLVRCWNQHLAGDDHRGLTHLNPRNEVRTYSLDWDDLPAALARDAAAFHARSLQVMFLDPDSRKPVRRSTANQRDRMLRRLATAEMKNGVDRDALQELADMVRPDHLKAGLEFFIARNDGMPNRQCFEMAFLALTIARHWAKLPQADIDRIKEWASRLTPEQTGMTEKNRERLRQFTEASTMRRLLNLPDDLVARAHRRPADQYAALMVQKAVMIGLLTAAPMRIGNLVTLDRQRHFRRAFSVDDRRTHIVIEKDEVKNSVDLEFPVPDWLGEIIDLYMTRFQAMLTNGHPSSLLFPGRNGGPKRDTSLRRNIVETINKELGLHVNPHLFRHLAALIFLRANPGQYESVRQLLGHKRVQTTIEFYASFESDEAAYRYNRVIEGVRDDSLAANLATVER